MSEDLIKCSCCGKMVPAKNVEIAFSLPDEVAALQEERDERCTYNNDLCVLDEKRFFIRCTIPLPVHECGEPYAIGAWAEIAESDYQIVWDLWDDLNQVKEPPINGNLANSIPLSTGSLNCSVAVKLTGPETRPHIIIADKQCSLFDEQECGISFHRASEYSDLLRKKEHDDRGSLTVVEEQELDPSTCSCCDRKIRTYCGYISEPENQKVWADYWIRIPEGHKGFFTVAVSIEKGGVPRVAVLLGEATSEGITYWVQDKKDSPWESFGEYGEVLDREDVLADEAGSMFYDMVDIIAANDSRLINHTAPYLNEE